MNNSDTQAFLTLNDNRPSKRPEPLISTYAQNKRILPAGTPFPGPWRNERTPYSVEIMDCMSPFSPVIKIYVMKSAQSGLTASAENVIAYWMDESPTEILYVSAIESLLERWAEKRLEPLIDSCGFRNKIQSTATNKKSRRTGDKILSKQYPGGTLDTASAQSASKLRSDSKRILICDEVDGAPSQLKTGEGSWLKVAFARTNAWGNRKKIFCFSTPTTFDQSAINRLFEEGDQRKYFVPCPHCGEFQVLEFGDDNTQYGIKTEMVNETLTVYYMCIKCHEAIQEYHKTDMLLAGQWRATAKAQSPDTRSYHLSALYSPIGMFSWLELWGVYQKALLDPIDGMRSFVNLYLGLPFRETGSRPKIEKVIELRGGYRSGTVPNGVIYLTAGIDVQAGSKKDPNNPPRLEMEILGIGSGWRTYSILYRRFEGEVDDPNDGAWQEMYEWSENGGLSFERKDGRKFPVSIAFIDSGDGNLTDTVYRFTERWDNCYPSKGFASLKLKKGETGTYDMVGTTNFRKYRPARVAEGNITLYEMSTNYYKTRIYNNLTVTRKETGQQRPGFCDFPIDYNEKYFKMLTAEEKRRDGTFYCPSGRRNESLDCRVMCLCAADIYLSAQIMKFKVAVKEKGGTDNDINQITARKVIDYLERNIG
ncbi:MAG: terminase gpA endonuclease subunit [Calditrichia bacterium]